MLYVVVAFNAWEQEKLGYTEAIRVLGVFHDEDVAKSWADNRQTEEDLGPNWRTWIVACEMGEGRNAGWPVSNIF